ncbi:MAG: HEAT repeat domain-containing protein [Gemmatimonadota bacterium]|nr:HEAT repeat domain-containing protein [Gemmatimonadota bacterium]
MDTSRQLLGPERMLMMAIELDHAPDSVWGAIDELAEHRIENLLEILRLAPPQSWVAADAWHRAITADRLRALVDSQSPNLETLERVLERIEAVDAGVLLDLLTESESLATRKRLFTRLVELAPEIAPDIVRRLSDDRWFARRNMLALMGELAEWPAKWTPGSHAADPNPVVRREAYKLMLKAPDYRDKAVCGLLADSDRKARSLGLAAAVEACPPEAVDKLAAIVNDGSVSPELRLMGVRALGRTGDKRAVGPLTELVRRGPGLGKHKLAEKSPVLIAALQALSTIPDGTVDSRKLVARAAKSSDPDVRAAVGGSGPVA